MDQKDFDYDQYRFPVCAFVAYIVLSVIGIVLFDYIVMAIPWLDTAEDILPFLAFLLSSVIKIVIFAVIMFVLAVILSAIGSIGIHQGVLFSRICNMICIASVFVMIVLCWIVIKQDTEISHYYVVTLVLECSIFPILRLALPSRCEKCGLINTYDFAKSERKVLERNHRFHNESTYYYTAAVYDGVFEKTSISNTYVCSVCGN